MAWRFKASKYKNAAPIVPKFEEQIRDLSIGSYMSHGNFIAASAAYMAFNWDTHGSNLAVLPVDVKGRQQKAEVPLIYAHGDFVTDFAFSPFDDGLLATGSQDSTIKLWKIPESGMPREGISNPELTLTEEQRKIETLNFNPAVDCILASSSHDTLNLWDLIAAEQIYAFDGHDDEIQSVGWQTTGNLIATQCKDKMLRVLDARSSDAALQCDSHQGMKDSKVVWISDGQRVLTTGFGSDRAREVTIRDIRNLTKPQEKLSLDISSGILVPLYDPDTNMCILCGKGDRTMQFVEIASKDPIIVEGLKHSGEQTKGACLVPKRAMNVMQGEVNRVLQLCDSQIIPITWQVPRKSYREYHADIYPDTNGYLPGMGPDDWWKSKCNNLVPKISLDPKKRPKSNLAHFNTELLSNRESTVANSQNNQPAQNTELPKIKSPSNDEQESRKISSPFIKPNPKPRGVVRSHTVAAASYVSSSQNGSQNSSPDAKPRKLDTRPSLSPKPSPRAMSTSHIRPNLVNMQDTEHRKNGISTDAQKMKSNGHINDNNDINDEVDEGLAALKRQPSIKDRRRLFEENIQRNLDAAPVVRQKDNSKIGQRARPFSSIIDGSEAELDLNKENSLKHVQQTHVPNQPVSNVFSNSRNSFSAVNVEPAPVTKPKVIKQFGRVSKFKHLKGEVMLKGKFDNLKNLSRAVTAESSPIQANAKRVAVPLDGPGGKIAVFETSKPGRIPDGVVPVLINGTTVMDFAFDPFDNGRLITGCDDGFVRVWKIPENGLSAPTNEPVCKFPAHAEKIQIVKFHPFAKDIIVTSAFDKTVKVWDLADNDEAKFDLQGHTEQAFSLDWSQNGRYIATVCKDARIRIYEPLGPTGEQPKIEGGDIVVKKGARILWVLDDQYLIVTGFNRTSERQVMVYSVNDLKEVHTVPLDVSPTILIPYYDQDSNTLFVTGKGESTVVTFEVSTDAPHLFALSPYKPPGLHQGFSFLSKNVCDVRQVEFARAFRLCNTTIEPITFTVPRVKTAYFQDDLFPPTKILWDPTIDSKDWLAGSKTQPSRLNLQPEDMKSLSSTRPSQDAQNNNFNNVRPQSTPDKFSAKQAQADITESVSSIMAVSNKLEQDQMEGVDEKEWDD